MTSTSAARTNISVLRVTAERFRVAPALAVALLLLITGASAQSANNESQDNGFDVKSSVGDMHLGNDGDIRETGLPAYPGARLKKDEKDGNNANLALLTSAFAFKLIVVKYDSDDAPSKVIAYYRGKLKKYGNVLECRTSEHGGDVSAHADGGDSDKSKELKCEGDNTGDVVELKVGTEDNEHIVAIEPAESGAGSRFAVVYLRTRGKQADI
jgi:hypothetical protein